jgi:hypothetical protein
VHKSYQPIQGFGHQSALELHLWLKDILKSADARAEAGDQLIRDSKSALTLVTCSDDVPLQPWRTLVVFVETASERDVGEGPPGMPSDG